MSGTTSGACLGHHLGHVWGIIWGMSGESSGACLGQHLKHIVNNGQQSAVIYASFFKSKDIKYDIPTKIFPPNNSRQKFPGQIFLPEFFHQTVPTVQCPSVHSGPPLSSLSYQINFGFAQFSWSSFARTPRINEILHKFMHRNNFSQGIADERVNGSKTMKMQCFPFYTLLLAIGNPTIDFLSLDIEVSCTVFKVLI